MTIELLDLDDLPADLVGQAHTLVAVSTANGPVRYKALVGVAGPGVGSGLTFRGAWSAATLYAFNDVLTYGGSSYIVTTAFASGSTFSTANLSVLAAGGSGGGAGGLSFSGAWTPSTSYAADAVLTYGGQAYVVVDAFVSASSFDTAHLAVLAAKGVDGTTPATIGLPDLVDAATLPGGIPNAALQALNIDGTDYRATLAAIEAAGSVPPASLPAATALVGGDAYVIVRNGVLMTLAASAAGSSTQGSSTGSGSTTSGSTGTGTGTTAPTGSTTGVLTMSNAVYADRGDGSGKKMLVGGTASGPVTIPSGDFFIKLTTKYGTTLPNTALPLLKLTNTAGGFIEMVASGSVIRAISSYYDGGPTGSGSVSADNAAHTASISTAAQYLVGFVDGAKCWQTETGDTFTERGALQIVVDAGNAPGGIYSMQIWSGSRDYPGTLQSTYEFDGSGAKS